VIPLYEYCTVCDIFNCTFCIYPWCRKCRSCERRDKIK
jgi:hypothetical protein